MTKLGLHRGIDAMKEFSIDRLPVRPTKLWGEIALFDSVDGLKVLDVCEQLNVSVLGIEGFRIVENHRVPDMNFIADFSVLIGVAQDRFPAASRESARNFINTISDEGVLLEFVLVEF